MQAVRYISQAVSPQQQSAIGRLTSNSFFASRKFLNLWKEMSGNAVYWTIEINDEIVALLPAIEFGIGKLKRLQALPDGCYSSIFYKDDLPAGQYSKILLDAIRSYGYQKIHVYDFYGTIPKAVGYDLLQCQTTLVDVSVADWQPPDRTLKSAIKKAERDNVQIVNFDSSRHFDKFMNLMHETEKRHGRKPKYSKLFFLALAELAQVDERIIWRFCEHENQPVSSHINIVEHNQIINWHISFDKHFSSLKANQKIVYDLAMLAKEKNIQYINLGASPVDSPSLVEYKNRWGGITKQYNCYYSKSFLGKMF